ncbi:MAG: hypothetical protein AB2L14_12255 [Candidatus Xenobiia bacterium LiM19]
MKRLCALIIFFILSLQPLMAYNGGYSPGYGLYTGKDGVRLFPLISFEQRHESYRSRPRFHDLTDSKYDHII